MHLLRIKKRWLWLALIPLSIVGLPILLFAMLIGSRLLSIVAGPVNIWNTTWHTPQTIELAGYYRLSEKSSAGLKRQGMFVPKGSGFRLGADHRLDVIELPAFDLSGHPANCNYNGTGDWRSFEDSEVTLSFNIKASLPAEPGNLPSCGAADLALFELLGHPAPYRIWYNIGDPDDEYGLTYVRQDR